MEFSRRPYLYLNNSATSYPKPPDVISAVTAALGRPPAMTGRGEEAGSEDLVWRTREGLADFFGLRDPAGLIFCANATDGLNLAIHGLLGERGGHAVTTTNDHNSVLRPLRTLEKAGKVELTVVRSDTAGRLSAEAVATALRPDTRLVAVNHLSNVVGTIAPLEEIAAVCRERGVILLVDAAQSGGILDIDVERSGVDLLAFTGHKYMLGPTGIGGLCIREGIELAPRKQGGTGVNSEYPFQPESLPIRYEAGTVNYVGIVGLGAAVDYIRAIGLPKIRSRIFILRRRSEESLRSIRGVTVWGPPAEADKGPVVSFTIQGHGVEETREILLSRYRIITRSGLHCAPLCHQVIGSGLKGTVRASFSYLTPEEGPEALAEAVREIASS
jgi:cysteine desulfurase family protein